MQLLAAGYNNKGQLGVGPTKTALESFTPGLELPPGIVSVQTCSFCSWAEDENGLTYSIGGGLFGQRCDGAKSEEGQWDWRRTLLEPVRFVVVRGDRGIACMPDGTLRTWGVNGWGQLGNGTSGWGDANTWPAGQAIDTPFAPRLPGGPVTSPTQPAAAVGAACGYNHDLACRYDGGAMAWGHNLSGQCANGQTSTRNADGSYTGDVLEPARCAKAFTVRDVAGGWGHSLFLRADGSVLGAGLGKRGELALPYPPLNYPTPTLIPLPGKALAIEASGTLSFAILEGGDLYEWGEDNPVPHKVLANCTQISSACYDSGGGCTNAAISDGEMFTWGLSNKWGQLGLGDREPHPAPVATGIAAKVVAAGETHSLALI